MRGDLKNCARCDEDHPGIEIRDLAQPQDDFKYWGTCPTIQQPILFRFVENGHPDLAKYRHQQTEDSNLVME